MRVVGGWAQTFILNPGRLDFLKLGRNQDFYLDTSEEPSTDGGGKKICQSQTKLFSIMELEEVKLE